MKNNNRATRTAVTSVPTSTSTAPRAPYSLLPSSLLLWNTDDTPTTATPAVHTAMPAQWCLPWCFFSSRYDRTPAKQLAHHRHELGFE